MLSDIAGFLVGVFSIFLTSRAADPRYSFGYHIAEVRASRPPVYEAPCVPRVLVRTSPRFHPQ